VKINQAMIESYLRHLAGAVFSAIVTVSTISEKAPTAFNTEDWYSVLNALWVAVLPVLVRYFNKKDAAFGVIASSVGEEVSKKIKRRSRKN